MAYFRCSTGSASSGDGVALVVQCDANFAGSVITATNGTDTFTETCPSVSPYTVRFEGIPTGTYTISGVSQGQTFTTQFTVLDYETTLNATPEGATVLPINDIQIWLHCANIWDKTYTTLDEVLADNTTLLALISSNNAVDYMARSTNWASSVTANSTAMTYIGANDYCATTLLGNSTWSSAICNSTYFESVLNVKVPTLTADTSQVIGTTADSSGGRYMVFDGVKSNYSYWAPTPMDTNAWIGYDFTNPIIVPKVGILVSSVGRILSVLIQGTNNLSGTWDTLATIDTSAYNGPAQNVTTPTYTNISNSTAYRYYRLKYNNITSYASLCELQFYGR